MAFSNKAHHERMLRETKVTQYYQELIIATKWCKGALNLCGLLVPTVVKNAAMPFLPFKDSANNRNHSLFTKQMAKYTRKP